MTRSGRSVRDHDWCVSIYEAGVILMVIRLYIICTYSKNRLIGILIATLIDTLITYTWIYKYKYMLIVSLKGIYLHSLASIY